MLVLAILLTAFLAIAAPTSHREKRALSSADAVTLQLAMYLENLEYALYMSGYNSFADNDFTAAGFPAEFRASIGVIAQQESFHVTAISELLEANGAATIPACTYKFPYTDAKSFVDLANLVTTVSIGASIKSIIDNADLRETAASILAVEGRHDAFLRSGIGLYPFPTTFDTGLTATWAYNIAEQFTVSCPRPLGYVKLASLQLVGPTAGPVVPGTTITFSWNPDEFLTPVSDTTPLYMAGIAENVTDPIYGKVTRTGANTGTIVSPPDIPSGVCYVCLTTFSGGLTMDQLTDFGTLAGPLQIMIS